MAFNQNNNGVNCVFCQYKRLNSVHPEKLAALMAFNREISAVKGV